MKSIYRQAVLFWFILLIIALINALIRETTYKPLLTPYIGTWAHQVSSLTGIIFFFIAIYFFLKPQKLKFSRLQLLKVGLIWLIMTIVFESFMGIYIRGLTWPQIAQTYYFWQGDTWVFVLLSLIISPQIIYCLLRQQILL